NPASQRRPVPGDHPDRRPDSDRGPPVRLRPRARNRGADAPPPDPGGDPQATVAAAGTVAPTQERRVASAMLKLLVVGSVALDTQLNVFETFRPRIPETYRSPDLLFLANIDPELQHTVLQQVKRPSLVACDTMNFWIEGKRTALIRLLKDVDVLIINDGEAR